MCIRDRSGEKCTAINYKDKMVGEVVLTEGVSVETEDGVSKGFDRVKSKCEL